MSPYRVFFSLLFFCVMAQGASAEDIQLTAAKAKALLRCPTVESQTFVDDCFRLVELGKLPQNAVISSFQYAMDKPKVDTRWYYFECSMDVWAKKLKVNLDLLRKALHVKKK